MDERPRHWTPATTVLPYLLLGLLTLVTAAHKGGGSLAVDLTLCALLAVWMLTVFTLRPQWRERTGVMAVFFAVFMVLTTVLVLRDPWFGFFTPACYVFAFRLVPWPWELLAVGSVAAVAGLAQAYGLDKRTALGVAECVAVLLANIVPMCGFAWFAQRGFRLQKERERALAEIQQANRRLEASLAENAVLHEQLLARAREAGVQDERRRMAREIHDTLAQGFTGIIAQLRAAAAVTDRETWQRHVDAAAGLAQESLAEARRSVHALRPEPLRTARLGEALTGVAERWTALHGTPVRVSTTGTAHALPPETELALLRTAQEALANVAKHAAAGQVALTLSYLGHEVALDVVDDGAGFDPERVTAAPPRQDGGFGLVGMRERIASVAGTLQIESEPGAGTGISARVPVDPTEVET
ncbi:sensor histidine kinase [Streptacidiphilus jiangxiensis]|uniref:Signal transduction histidine kinase n=1 Tax=Streptacidiphilus jiangxiensis TaxID=235985 RepID=A0A1H7S8W0_STRJI|nr:sensor histidine kinase [Streptacidiphilus jiangxiensis]SEL69071.1 Signal transduction histidine kinase [Streptacidiphilus jiangxiensis]